jgi:glucosamine--fructose-6-phosphate aminotransferase (isomerizing)
MSEVINQPTAKASATYQTIIEQSAEIKRLLHDTKMMEKAEGAARLLGAARRVFLVGTGTSSHAAQMGQFLLRVAGLNEAWAVPAFDFALYPQPLAAEDVVIIISHRGTKRFGRRSIEKARAAGAKLVLITGQSSPLLAEPDALVLETTAQERSSTHTASYITALIVLTKISCYLAEKKSGLATAEKLCRGLKETASTIETAIAQEDKIRAAARQMGSDGARIFFTGPGPSGVTAMEGALKCKEAAYVTAEGSHLETFLHGPIVGLGLGDHLVMLNSFATGPAAERTADVARAMQQVGVKVWLVGRAPAGLQIPVWVELDAPFGEELCASIVQTVPLQLLACFLAEVRGTNPDSFRLDIADYKAAISAITL